MELYAVIMAGGIGSRFWPRSREKKPKQLIRIFGSNTMIQDTVERLDGLVSQDHIFVITNRLQKPRVKEQLPGVPAENIIDEPFGKNTAACIGLASVIIARKSPEAVVITLPADHLIQDAEGFRNCIIRAAEFAEGSDGLVTIGVKPTRPETGYGYIQIDEKTDDEEVHKVLNFAEKPHIDTAKRFLASGDFMWNSGMFIWKISSILSEIESLMPELYQGLEQIKSSLGKSNFQKTLVSVYGQLKSVSIDYGIMEKSKKVYLLKGSFDWNDVGSWEAVYELSDKDQDMNAIVGDVYTEKTKNSYIFSPKKFTSVIGVDNIVVINTDSSLLICNRENAQDVKHVVDYLKMNKRQDQL